MSASSPSAASRPLPSQLSPFETVPIVFTVYSIVGATTLKPVTLRLRNSSSTVESSITPTKLSSDGPTQLRLPIDCRGASLGASAADEDVLSPLDDCVQVACSCDEGLFVGVVRLTPESLGTGRQSEVLLSNSFSSGSLRVKFSVSVADEDGMDDEDDIADSGSLVTVAVAVPSDDPTDGPPRKKLTREKIVKKQKKLLRSPLFPLFSPKYPGLEPLLRIVFSYLHVQELISRLSLVSTHLQVLVSRMSFGRTKPTRYRADVSGTPLLFTPLLTFPPPAAAASSSSSTPASAASSMSPDAIAAIFEDAPADDDSELVRVPFLADRGIESGLLRLSRGVPSSFIGRILRRYGGIRTLLVEGVRIGGLATEDVRRRIRMGWWGSVGDLRDHAIRKLVLEDVVKEGEEDVTLPTPPASASSELVVIQPPPYDEPPEDEDPAHEIVRGLFARAPAAAPIPPDQLRRFVQRLRGLRMRVAIQRREMMKKFIVDDEVVWLLRNLPLTELVVGESVAVVEGVPGNVKNPMPVIECQEQEDGSTIFRFRVETEDDDVVMDVDGAEAADADAVALPSVSQYVEIVRIFGLLEAASALYERVVTICPNLRLFFVLVPEGSVSCFPSSFHTKLRKESPPPIGVWQAPFSITFTKDHMGESFVDRNGMMWKIALLPKNTKTGEDSVYFYSRNSLLVVEASFRAELQHGDVLVRRVTRRAMFPRAMSGWGFYHFSRWDFDKNPEMRVTLQCRIDRIFSPAEFQAHTAQLVTKAIEGRKMGGYDFTLSLPRFDTRCSGGRSFKKEFELCSMPWEFTSSYEPVTKQYSIYFYNHLTEFLVVVCSLRVMLNDMVRCIDEQVFVESTGFGWEALMLDSDDIKGSIVMEILKVYTKEEFAAVRERKMEESRRRLETGLVIGPPETVDFKMYLQDLSGSSAEVVTAVGIPWKVLYQRKRGKFDRSALFVYCDFEGDFIVSAQWRIQIPGTDFDLKSTIVYLHEGRGWGFDELTFPQLTASGITPMRLTVQVFSRMTTLEAHTRNLDLVQRWEASGVKDDERVIELPTRGRLNPYQSPAFLICGFLPFFIEFYPNGVEDLDLIDFSLFHQLRFFHLSGTFTVSAWSELEKREIVKTVSEAGQTVRFPHFARKNLDQNWRLKLKIHIDKVVDLK